MSSPTDDEVPEADALEQSTDVEWHASDPPPSIDDEVPEADALEQATPVLDDDDRR
jgi:hypothetical protein